MGGGGGGGGSIVMNKYIFQFMKRFCLPCKIYVPISRVRVIVSGNI